MTTDKAMVTEDMVTAAAIEIQMLHGAGKTVNEQARRILTAALTLERGEAEPVAVKPLEWREEPVPPSGESLAPSVVGLYCIPHGGDRFYLRFRDSSTLGDFGTLERAKAAAQSDYDTRILSTLSKRGEAEETPAPETSVDVEPDALELRYRDGFEDGEKQAVEAVASAQCDAATYKAQLDALTSRLRAECPAPVPHVSGVQALLNSLDRTAIAKIMYPSAWLNEDGDEIEQEHSGASLHAADQIITYVLRKARALATTEGSDNG